MRVCSARICAPTSSFDTPSICCRKSVSVAVVCWCRLFAASERGLRAGKLGLDVGDGLRVRARPDWRSAAGSAPRSGPPHSDRSGRPSRRRASRNSAPGCGCRPRWRARHRKPPSTDRCARSRCARAGSVPASPVYQITVLAAVPATMPVAVSKGGPLTRCGGLPASASKNVVGGGHRRCRGQRGGGERAEGAGQRGLQVGGGGGRRRADGELIGAGRRLRRRGEGEICAAAVGQGEPQGEGIAIVGIAARQIDRERRGRAARAADRRVGQVRGDRSKLEAERRGRSPRRSATEVAVGALITRRPSPLAPRSAWLRSEMSCLSPARAPSPLRM